MDSNITQTVYNNLFTATEEISESVAKQEELQAKIDSNRYTGDTIRKEIVPKMDQLKEEIRRKSDAALKNAQDLIDKYRAEAAEANVLNPADITDDVKLLQSGITLLPRDIQGILDRNKGNRTMTQIVLRYAQEHNIDTGGTYYTGGQQEEEIAKALEGILFYYKNWIGTPRAMQMLDKFFRG